MLVVLVHGLQKAASELKEQEELPAHKYARHNFGGVLHKLNHLQVLPVLLFFELLRICLKIFIL